MRYVVPMTCAPRRPNALFVLLIAAACGGTDADDGGTGSTQGSSESTAAVDSSGTPTTSSSTMTTASSAEASGSDDTGASSGVVDTSGDGSTGTTGGGVCGDVVPAIVTDIDETLTISDAEFLIQLGDGNYDPVEREGAAEMITAYADLGYRIMYLTARAESLMAVNTGETARELTERWLLEHEFPNDPETTIVVLSPNLVVGDSAREYKAAVLMEQQAAGWRFDYAYGNATSDIGAYADAGIPLEVTFIIGPEAGTDGTVAIEGEGWVDHTAAHLPTVPAVCEAAE